MTAIDTLRSGIARTAERLTEDARSRNGAAFVIAGVLGLLAPVLVGGYTLDLVMQLIILILVVTSWIFIAGYFGMFSFAHAALYGIGAYAAVPSRRDGDTPHHRCATRRRRRRNPQHPDCAPGASLVRGHTSEWSHWRSRRSSTGW